MSDAPAIDTAFDMRSDAGGRNPDQHSPTLRKYHELLWGKQLPTGGEIRLETSPRPNYLIHRSPDSDLYLASDAIIRTFNYMQKMQPIVTQVSAEQREAFNTRASTIGGMTLFPGKRIDHKPTINGARGMHPKIADRFDLTLECLRRFYAGQSNPLTVTLSRYSTFFKLFGDFGGYVEFFLLEDLVVRDRPKFFLRFEDFERFPLPSTEQEYIEYRTNTIAFVEARNHRIARYVDALVPSGPDDSVRREIGGPTDFASREDKMQTGSVAP